MTTRRQFLSAGAALSFTPQVSAGARGPDYAEGLSSAFEGSGVPALGGLVVGPDGTVWSGARGLRRAGEGDAVKAGDQWHLGSNTKAMTAALYGRLVDQRRAHWDSRLRNLLPDLPMAPEWRDVSITQVMSHSAGLRDATAMGAGWLNAARADPRPVAEQRSDLARAMMVVPPAGPSGTFAYANANYVLIGAIIEKITGQAWEAVMQEQLFAPLGITTGGFGPPQGAQPWGHTQTGPADPSRPGSDNPPAMGPAGTAHMALEDYARFLREFLPDDSGWLHPQTRATLMRAGNVGPPAYAGGWLLAEGQPWARGAALTHDGSNTLWYVSTWLAPALNRAFVAVSNDGVSGAAACQQLIRNLVQTG